MFLILNLSIRCPATPLSGKRVTSAVRHLVQVSGLPKESVRRKLEKLHERGKLGHDDDGHWVALRTGVDETTYEFTRESVKRLLQTARVIEGILQRARLD